MKYIHITVMLFINIIIINIAESSTNLYWNISITNNKSSVAQSMPIMITPTNLVVKYPSVQNRFRVKYDRWDYSINNNGYTPKPNDEIIITTNRITEIYHGEAAIGYKFTPVSFTNNLIGFRVYHDYATKWDWSVASGPIAFTNHTYYVALSDTLVEVGEADVDNPNIAKMEDEED